MIIQKRHYVLFPKIPGSRESFISQEQKDDFLQLKNCGFWGKNVKKRDIKQKNDKKRDF